MPAWEVSVERAMMELAKTNTALDLHANQNLWRTKLGRFWV